jgi:hypothetical protein
MRTFLQTTVILILASLAITAQKGVDTQTQKIKDDSNKTTTRSSDATRSFDWGKGKTRVRDRLANPYQLNGRRDQLVEMIKLALTEKKMVVDESSSRFSDGVVVTQPYMFGRGTVIASNEIKRYAILEFGDDAWSRAQYTLTIEIQSIDGMRNNVYVNAKVEGRAGAGLIAEWRTLQSSGLAEEEFLVKLVEIVTGVSPDEPEVDN